MDLAIKIQRQLTKTSFSKALIVGLYAGLPSFGFLSVSLPALATADEFAERPDGEFRFTLKDAWFGKQAEISYQTTPDLRFSWQAGRLDGEIGLQAATDFYQYNAHYRLWDSHVALPLISGLYFSGINIGARDFAGTADKRSGYAHALFAARHAYGNWQGYLGSASGDGLDGMQAGVALSFHQYPVSIRADYHAQQDWHVSGLGNSTELAGFYDAPQWSVGAQWRPYPWLSFSATHDEVKSLGLGVTVHLDSRKPSTRKISSLQANQMLEPLLLALESEGFGGELADVIAALDINLHAFEREDEALTLVISTEAYAHWPDAISTLHGLLSMALPSDIADVEYIITDNGHALYCTRLALNHLSKGQHKGRNNNGQHHQQVMQWAKQHSDMRLSSLLPAQLSLWQAPVKRQVPQANVWSRLVPEISADVVHQVYTPSKVSDVHFAGLNNELTQYVGAHMDASWILTPSAPSWTVETSINVDLLDAELDSELNSELGSELNSELNSGAGLPSSAGYHGAPLPIRSAGLIAQQQKSARLTKLALVKRGTALKHARLASNSIHYRVSLGQVSDDLVGINTQWLYQPWQSRVAFGLSIAELKAIGELESLTKSYDMASESTVTSAVVSGYWATPWQNIDVAVHAGRFVGQDTGAQVQIKRTFHNGWQFGLWSSHTEKDGHSQHDHGIALQIPLDGWFGQAFKHVSTKRLRYQSTVRNPHNNAGVLPTELASGRDADIWWQQRDVRFDVFSERQ